MLKSGRFFHRGQSLSWSVRTNRAAACKLVRSEHDTAPGRPYSRCPGHDIHRQAMHLAFASHQGGDTCI
ncbi:hypothetical protein D9X30_3131 [Cupriavidus sp. U2]|nr:hypothetical protein D9X30_3131 [Cupriavidus sp. U2]